MNRRFSLLFGEGAEGVVLSGSPCRKSGERHSQIAEEFIRAEKKVGAERASREPFPPRTAKELLMKITALNPIDRQTVILNRFSTMAGRNKSFRAFSSQMAGLLLLLPSLPLSDLGHLSPPITFDKWELANLAQKTDNSANDSFFLVRNKEFLISPAGEIEVSNQRIEWDEPDRGSIGGGGWLRPLHLILCILLILLIR